MNIKNLKTTAVGTCAIPTIPRLNFAFKLLQI